MAGLCGLGVVPMRSVLRTARDHVISNNYPARQEITTGVFARAMSQCVGGAQGDMYSWDETLDSGPWEKTPVMREDRDHVIVNNYPARQEITAGVFARAMSQCVGGAQSDMYGWYRGGPSLNAVDIEGRIGFGTEGGGVPATPKWRIF